MGEPLLPCSLVSNGIVFVHSGAVQPISMAALYMYCGVAFRKSASKEAGFLACQSILIAHFPKKLSRWVAIAPVKMSSIMTEVGTSNEREG